MIWKRILVLLTVVAMLVVCAACGSKDVQDATGESAGTPSIVAPGKEDSEEDLPDSTGDSAVTTEEDSEEDLG